MYEYHISDRITDSSGRNSTGMGSVVDKAYFGFIVESFSSFDSLQLLTFIRPLKLR